MLGHSARRKAAAAGGEEDEEGGWSSDEGGSGPSSSSSSSQLSSDDEMAGASSDSEAGVEQAQQAADMELDSAAAAGARAAYAARDPSTGTPRPLLPKLVTLSLLPRTQWQNLAHLDTIRARNKPIQPPKKPEAAPFFLPTVLGADAGRNPIFDLAGAAAAGGQEEDAGLAAKAAAAWGEGEDEEEGRVEVDFDEEGATSSSSSSEGESDDERAPSDGGGSRSDEEGAGGAAAAQQQPGARRKKGGRIFKAGGRGAASPLVALLRRCSEAGDWTSVLAHLRALPPVQVDAQIREMQVRCAMLCCAFPSRSFSHLWAVMR